MTQNLKRNLTYHISTQIITYANYSLLMFFLNPPVRCNRWEQVQTGHSERNSIVIRSTLLKIEESAPLAAGIWTYIFIEFRPGLQTVRVPSAPVSPIKEENIANTHLKPIEGEGIFWSENGNNLSEFFWGWVGGEEMDGREAAGKSIGRSNFFE